MAFIDHIGACNAHDPSRFIPFRMAGMVVGRLLPAFAEMLQSWPELFEVRESEVVLHCHGEDLETRSARVAGVLNQLMERGVLSHFHGEQYAAMAEGRREPMLLLDRAIAPYFGIRAFGQHVNGIVRTDQGLKMWISRRADNRRHYPGYLDNLAAGGLPYGMSLSDNLAKESWEEAGIPADLARKAVAAGAVSYHLDTERGFKADTLYCYDLELPEEFVPCCMDGEVQAFYLMPIEEVLERVRDTNQFKLNCNLVLIDFFIRNGYIGPDDEHYLALLSGLHPTLPVSI